MTGSALELSRRSLFKRLFAFIVYVVVVPCLFAQDGTVSDGAESAGSAFAPYVSRLRISTRDPEVRLTWIESADVDGGYQIYRHTSEINAETFLNAKLVGEVEAGTRSFIDAPPQPGDYFYAVLAESASGEVYEIFIPDQNSTLTPVTVANVPTLVEQSASGQDEGGSDGAETAVSVFAPFVSRLRISTRDPEVRLTWTDSVDVDGGYEIYRHTSEINTETFLDAELVGEVARGARSFIDAPPEPGDYYYAVLAESAAGGVYEIFIPYRNATFAPVAVARVATLIERSARVRDIRASEEDGVIRVEYQSDQIGRELIVYRSVRPFLTAEDLLSAGVVATVMSTIESVIDYPVPGVLYYYAVVDAALVAESMAAFETGANATETPVEIPLPGVATLPESTRNPTPEPAEEQPEEFPESPQSPISPQIASAPAEVENVVEPEVKSQEEVFVPKVSRRRPLPLPFLQLNTNLLTGERIGDVVVNVPDRQSISSTTQAALDEMLGRLTPESRTIPGPEVLSEDALPSPRGVEFTLRTILDGPFANLAWEDALLQLNNFLSLPLPDDVRSRAIFYRAQVLYFIGEFKRAFVEFLLAQNTHFAEVEGWLDVILSDSSDA